MGPKLALSRDVEFPLKAGLVRGRVALPGILASAGNGSLQHMCGAHCGEYLVLSLCHIEKSWIRWPRRSGAPCEIALCLLFLFWAIRMSCSLQSMCSVEAAPQPYSRSSLHTCLLGCQAWFPAWLRVRVIATSISLYVLEKSCTFDSILYVYTALILSQLMHLFFFFLRLVLLSLKDGVAGPLRVA